MSYRLANSGIIHELLNDEVIIANLDTGVYYSIRGSGVQIWQLLLEGHLPSSIESLFLEKYAKTPPLSPFIDRLVEENLLIAIEENAAASFPSLSWPSTFELPLLERYDEMKNLLMLDPIHEVDEEGWPNRK